MSPKLYMNQRSPPCRAVLVLAKILGLQLTEISIEVLKNEHLTPEFLKMNPQHTIPTLDDDGTILCDSHAIMPYLTAKYGKDDSLYPKEPGKRALIDQRLHFDSGTLWKITISVIYSIIRDGIKEIPQANVDLANEAYGFLEKFLEKGKWVAGDDFSLADIALYTSAQSLDVMIPIDLRKYPKLAVWIKKIEALPCFEINKAGHEAFKTFMYQFWKA